MSQSSTIQSTSTPAIVENVDIVEVGKETYYFVQVRYLDYVARPDIAGRLSGWIRQTTARVAGDIVNVRFEMKQDRLGNTFYQPFIRRT